MKNQTVMKKLVLISGMCMALSASGLALACSEPSEKPEIPDPNASETAQMVKANNEVKAYVAAMQEYLGCARMSSSQQRREVKALEEFAEEFNQAVRTFRSLNE